MAVLKDLGVAPSLNSLENKHLKTFTIGLKPNLDKNNDIDLGQVCHWSPRFSFLHVLMLS